MKKRIGILGGVSLASSLVYMRTIAANYHEQHGDIYYPEMLLYSLDFGRFTDMENEGRTQDYIDYILEGLEGLARAGADFAAMSANSPHSVFEQLKEKSPLPMISIVDAVGREAQRRGMKTLLLTGIYYTMQHDFYQKGLAAYGISVCTPDEAQQREIDRMIFEELTLERFTDEARASFVDILRKNPCDGVILGCTELPLLLQQSQTDIPLLDSLNLHCEAILKESLGR